MPEDVAQDLSLVALLAGGDAGDDDALGIDHLSHHAAAAVGGAGQDGAQSQTLGADPLEPPEEDVRRGVAPGERHPEPAQKRREEREEKAGQRKGEPHRRVQAGIAGRESQGEHGGDRQERPLHPPERPAEYLPQLGEREPEEETAHDSGQQEARPRGGEPV